MLVFCLFPFPTKESVEESKGFPDGSDGKESDCSTGDVGSIPRSGRSPGKENGIHSNILAWKVPWTEEPGRLQPVCHKVKHNWAGTHICLFMYLPLHLNYKSYERRKRV